MGIRDDRKLMDDLCEIENGLTEWEVKFVDDMARQVHDDKRPLTSGQRSKAQEIWDREFGE